MKKSSALAVRSDSHVIDVDFSGHRIRRDGDHLHATDMWKAAGGDPSKRPSKWLDQKGTREYLGALGDVLPGDTTEVRVERGSTDGSQSGGGGTWLHKLAAVEYARYLDPAFAVFVNRLFLDVTEDGGRMLAAAGVVSPGTIAIGDDGVRALVAIGEGVRNILDNQKAHNEQLQDHGSRLAQIESTISTHLMHKRKTPTRTVCAEHVEAIRSMGGLCPFCDAHLFDADGRFVGNIHHHDKASDARVEATMPTCGPCNQRFNIDPTPRFVVDAYHARRLRLSGPLFRRRSA